MRSGSLLLVLALAIAGPTLADEPKEAQEPKTTEEPAACPVGTDARTDLAKGKTEAKVKPGTFEDVVQGDVSRAKEAAASRAEAEEAAPIWESEDDKKAQKAKKAKDAAADKAKKADAEREKGR